MCAELRPHVHWVPVVDTRGRQHLEMRWSMTGVHADDVRVGTRAA